MVVAFWQEDHVVGVLEVLPLLLVGVGMPFLIKQANTLEGVGVFLDSLVGVVEAFFEVVVVQVFFQEVGVLVDTEVIGAYY